MTLYDNKIKNSIVFLNEKYGIHFRGQTDIRML